jgi:hypothetical protein
MNPRDMPAQSSPPCTFVSAVSQALKVAVIFWANNTYAGRAYSRSYGYSFGNSYSPKGYGGFSSSGKSGFNFSTPQRNYSRGGETYMQKGYFRNDGNFVMPHFKTRPDNYRWNNLNEWAR